MKDVKTATEIADIMKAGFDAGVEVYHVPADFHCDDCDFTHKEQKGIFLHRRIHEKASCRFCGKEWTLHGIARHENACSESPVNRALSHTKKCDKCGKSFTNRGFPSHQKWHDRMKNEERREAYQGYQGVTSPEVPSKSNAEVEFVGKLAGVVFGDSIPVNKIGEVVSWMEMTQELIDELAEINGVWRK